MKIVSFKRALGLLALGGAAAYVHKKYGFRNLGEKLKQKLAPGKKDDQMIDVTPKPTHADLRSPGMPGSRVGVTPPRP
jgi:hypothetical protein